MSKGINSQNKEQAKHSNGASYELFILALTTFFREETAQLRQENVAMRTELTKLNDMLEQQESKDRDEG